MTCYRCGYCCDHINITGTGSMGWKIDASTLPSCTLNELADVGVPLAGRCIEHLKPSVEHELKFYYTYQGKSGVATIKGDFYICALYGFSHRPALCANANLNVAPGRLEQGLAAGESLPRCLVAEKFGPQRLEEMPGIKSVALKEHQS